MDQLGNDLSFDEPFLVALDVSPPRCEGIVAPINFSLDEVISGIRDEALRTITTDPITIDGINYSV